MTQTCISAPAGARERVTAVDAARAVVAERRVVEGKGRYALRVEAQDGREPVELGLALPVAPRVAGQEVLAVRPAPVAPGDAVVSRTRGGALREVGALVAIPLGGGAARALSAPGHDVTSFVVAGERVLYAAGFSLYEVPLVGGAPEERFRKTVDVHDVAPDGTVIASVVGDNQLVLARLRADGRREELATDAERAAVVGDRIYLQDLDGDPVFVAPLAGGPAEALPDYRPGDRLVASPGFAALSRDLEGGGALFLPGEANPAYRVYGGRIRWADAGGALVLVAHDTDANGQLNGLDEADLCRFSASQAELRVPERTLPLAWAEARTALEAKVREMGLSLMDLRVVDGATVASLSLSGDGPASAAGLLDVARALQALFPVKTGIYVSFSDSGRFGAIATIDGVEQRRAGFVDALVWTQPGDLSLEVQGFSVSPEGDEARCSGRVKNVGPAPRSLLSSCGPYGTPAIGFGWLNGPPPSYRTPTEPSSLESSSEGHFSVLAEGPAGARTVRFYDRDELIPALDLDANDRSARLFKALSDIAEPDHLRVGEYMPPNVGWLNATEGSSIRVLRTRSSWQAEAFELRVPADRTVDAAWRDALATRATAKLADFPDPPALWLRAGGLVWELDHGVFVPREQPPSLFGD